jgi:hypothetical protein
MNTRNRHPVDELADVRAELRRLEEREAELRIALQLEHIPLAAVLRYIRENPAVSCASLAIAMEWKLRNSEPNRMKALRCINALNCVCLIKRVKNRRWRVTPEGAEALSGNDQKSVTAKNSKMSSA